MLYLHRNILVYFHSTFLEEDLAYESVCNIVRQHKLHVPEKNRVKKEVLKKNILLKSYKLIRENLVSGFLAINRWTESCKEAKCFLRSSISN